MSHSLHSGGGGSYDFPPAGSSTANPQGPQRGDPGAGAGSGSSGPGGSGANQSAQPAAKNSQTGGS